MRYPFSRRVVEYVKEVRGKDPEIGGNKLWLMYQARFGENNSVGYNRFYDILDRYCLKVRKRRHRTRTTDSNHSIAACINSGYSDFPSLSFVHSAEIHYFCFILFA